MKMKTSSRARHRSTRSFWICRQLTLSLFKCFFGPRTMVARAAQAVAIHDENES